MFVGANVHDAERAVTGAERRKLPVPTGIREAHAVRQAVLGVGSTPDPQRPALPGTAKDTAAVIQAHAEALRLADVTRRAAGLFADEADLRYIQAVAAAVPAWIDGLQKEFATLVGVVTKAAARLPDDLAQVVPGRLNWNNPVYATAYNKAEGAVAQLQQLVSDRADICKVAGSDGGRDNALYAVAALPEPTVDTVMDQHWTGLAQAVAGWRDLAHQPVARWVYLVRQGELSLSLATPGQVRERATTVQVWREATCRRATASSRADAEAGVHKVLAA